MRTNTKSAKREPTHRTRKPQHTSDRGIKVLVPGYRVKFDPRFGDLVVLQKPRER